MTLADMRRRLNMRRIVRLLLTVTLGFCVTAHAQGDANLADLEARIMARLERRIAEESAATNGQISMLRTAVREAVNGLSKSANKLDQRALVAIDVGAVKEGVTALEDLAHARDAALNAKDLTESDVNLRAEKQQRAEEWKRIGALAFLDNTDHAISAYQDALRFAPDDVGILSQLGELYMRQGRWADRISVGERLTALKDPEAQAEGLFNIADSYMEQAQLAKARPVVDRCIDISRSSRVSRLESRCLSLAAGLYVQEASVGDAERLAKQALIIARDGGYQFEEGMALYLLAVTGEQNAAMTPPSGRRAALLQVDRRYSDLERLLTIMHDPAAEAAVMVNRGRVALALGDAAGAESRLRGALAKMEGSHTTGRIAYVEQELGRALMAQNRIDEAIPYFRSSVRKARDARAAGYEAVALMSWATAEAARSNGAEACRLMKESYRVFVEGVPELRGRQQAEQQVKRLCQ
jgi:tetratricopeptide (TPR) repeat protein